MATVVVAGRVDEETKRKAERHIRAAGMTANEVIKAVWSNIAATGEVPQPIEPTAELAEKRKRLEEFVTWCDALPPCPELANMTDEDMRDMIVKDLIEANYE